MSRRRYTNEEKAELLAEFDRSGGSAAAFCRERGLSYQTFMAWRRKPEGTICGPVPVPEFVEIEVGAARRNQSPGGPLVELELGGGMVLRISPCHPLRP